MSAEEPALLELLEFLQFEQRENWQHGHRITIEAFLERDARLAHEPFCVLQLVYNEILLLERAGERPRLEDYVRRWPHLAEELGALFEVHWAIESDRLLSAIGGCTAYSETLPDDEVRPNRSFPTIAGYEILEEVGRGGMGVVYKARQLSLNRVVALKMILGGSHANEVQQARFRNETEVIARLHHPNIVQIYHVGDDDGCPYYTMEFVEGPSLAQELDGTPWPARSAATLVATLARAIHTAHLKGIIHRDLKPANILMEAEPGSEASKASTLTEVYSNNKLAKITDFGLAKLLDLNAGQTGSGAILGTPSYMAPEQARSDHKQIGPATDVYSLGVILYELLTGRPPFRAQTPLETLRQVLSHEPVSLARFELKVPRDLETICLKCLRKEPQQRYPSALELSEDLERFLTGRPIIARRTSGWERSYRWCRRNPGWTAAIGLLLTVAFGASLSAILLDSALVRAEHAERQTTNQLFEALLTRVEAGRGSGRPGQRFAGLASIRQAVEIARSQNRPATDLLHLRNEAIACLALPDLQMEAEWEGNPRGTNGIDFDETFERYAWSFNDEGIRVRRLSDHTELHRIPTPPGERVSRWVRFRFSPEGRYLAANYRSWGDKNSLEVWDLSEKNARRIVHLADTTAISQFTADGRSLIAMLPGGEVDVIELPSGRELQRLPSGGEAEALALHPEETLLAVGGGLAGGARVLDLKTGAIVHRLPHAAVVKGLAWSPDGKLLATACNDHRIHLWDEMTGLEVGQFVGHRWEVQDVGFDPSGKWLASFGWDMTLRIWEVATRRQVLTLQDVRILGFRRKGWLAAAALSGQKVQFWGFRPSQVLQELHTHESVAHALEFSPDSRLLASSDFAVELRLWDVETGRELIHRPDEGAPLWGPSGDWMLVAGSHGVARIPLRLQQGNDTEQPSVELGKPLELPGLEKVDRFTRMGWSGAEGRQFYMADTDTSHPRAMRVRVFDLLDRDVHLRWESRVVPDLLVPSVDRHRQLLAVGSFDGGNGVSIWDADTGRTVHQLPIGDAAVAFSADGLRLFTTTGRVSPRGAECRSWQTDSWEPERAVPTHRISSSPAHLKVASDGTVAVTHTMSDVRLLDPLTLEERATLVMPVPGLIAGMSFSPDSTLLATGSSQTIHLWNLQLLQRELAAMGLNWEQARIKASP